MQHQVAGRKAISKRAPQHLCLLGALTVTDDVVRVSLERNVRTGPRHPHVERVVQEQIRQQGTDNSALRRSCRARDDAAVLHLYRRLQPAFDVEQHPWTTRMMPDRLEQQLPIDAVEGRGDRLPITAIILTM